MVEKQKETGGPAFPCEMLGVDEHGSYRKPYEGMTLRDYFASSFVSSGHVFKKISNGFTPEEVADQAYKLADAMMEAREQ